MKSSELDKRVGDYAAAIVRDADLLLADTTNLNAEQQHFAEALKRDAVRFLTHYRETLPYFTLLNDESRQILHNLRAPLSTSISYCDLLLSGKLGSWSQFQLQLLQQIKAAQDFIVNTFDTWVTSRQGTDNQLN